MSFFEAEKEWENEELNNEKVNWHKPLSVFGERYYCLVSSCGVEFEVVLTYHTKEQLWTIDNQAIDIRKLTFGDYAD